MPVLARHHHVLQVVQVLQALAQPSNRAVWTVRPGRTRQRCPVPLVRAHARLRLRASRRPRTAVDGWWATVAASAPRHIWSFASAMDLNTPRDQLITALVAVHAFGISDMRALQVDDLDRRRGTLRVVRQDREFRVILDELVLQLVTDWLRVRATRWPATNNPHLLISGHTAHNRGPMSRYGLEASFRKLDITPNQLRTRRGPPHRRPRAADPCVRPGHHHRDPVRPSSAPRTVRPGSRQSVNFHAHPVGLHGDAFSSSPWDLLLAARVRPGEWAVTVKKLCGYVAVSVP